VRKVVGLTANEQVRRVAGVHKPESTFGPTTVDIVASDKQNLQTERQVGVSPPVVFQSDQGDGRLSSAVRLEGCQDALQSFENLQAIRWGTIEMAEMAFLARGVTAAQVWSHNQAVEVILDGQAASVVTSDQQLESIHAVQAPPANPKLRVIKVASTQLARPGEEVTFYIRFDNVGNQVIGNVTIIDNLTTRLEYVPDSAQCSLDAKFLTEPNEGGSLVIRCEITDPLQPDEGGIVRFRCRVR
jgi:uncharacterized repeat protein (TIGR01451 family)